MKRVYISQRITQQLITIKDFARQPMIGVELEVAFVLSPTTDTYTCLHLSAHAFSSSVCTSVFSCCTGLLTCRVGHKPEQCLLYWGGKRLISTGYIHDLLTRISLALWSYIALSHLLMLTKV